jgi:CRISPR/Cas system-associated exonuclease Cas4 (RecB family)
MTETLTLSRYQLATFLTCQRRFQLRYLRRIPWPATPLDERHEAAVRRGQQFHQLLERHFLGLPVETAALNDADLRRWWTLFANSGLRLPDGRLLPELSLTVPIDGHLLTGRFDLLVLGEDKSSGAAYAHVFDWKTGRPRDEADLRQDWQTRLYLAILAEGGGALWDNGRTLAPDHIVITYWYVNEPEAPRTLAYSTVQHADNWADIRALVAQISRQMTADAWPLTDDLARCRECAYQVYCDRQGVGLAPHGLDEDEEPAEEDWLLEPDLP